MIPLGQYRSIKDKYCVVYLGACDEYVIQMICLTPTIEAALPGLQFYIVCKDELFHRLPDIKNLVSYSDFRCDPSQFAHAREIECDFTGHPIMKLAEESSLSVLPFPSPAVDHTCICVISPKAQHPTKSLTRQQIDHCAKLAKTSGYECKIQDDTNGAGWVIGPENFAVFQAAMMGLRTSLVPSGDGTVLYKKLFPKGELVKMPDKI